MGPVTGSSWALTTVPCPFSLCSMVILWGWCPPQIPHPGLRVVSGSLLELSQLGASAVCRSDSMQDTSGLKGPEEGFRVGLPGEGLVWGFCGLSAEAAWFCSLSSDVVSPFRMGVAVELHRPGKGPRGEASEGRGRSQLEECVPSFPGGTIFGVGRSPMSACSREMCSARSASGEWEGTTSAGGLCPAHP